MHGMNTKIKKNMKILFCKANNIPLFDELPQKGILYFITELNMQNKLM
jgi:hypothetical protein